MNLPVIDPKTKKPKDCVLFAHPSENYIKFFDYFTEQRYCYINDRLAEEILDRSRVLSIPSDEAKKLIDMANDLSYRIDNLRKVGKWVISDIEDEVAVRVACFFQDEEVFNPAHFIVPAEYRTITISQYRSHFFEVVRGSLFVDGMPPLRLDLPEGVSSYRDYLLCDIMKVPYCYHIGDENYKSHSPTPAWIVVLRTG